MIHHYNPTTAEQWQVIAPSKTGEPQASQSPLGVTDHNDLFPRGASGG